ncbi:hypothetical protein BU26DRAFT_15759 [Trematosphaeria pertusa]|uniref:BTB domain-containing protein n=1 Tax=Trematosphaeria pertusa TaxID=390896 RepID=A0A6A6J3W1_9PLEO|nr:uncharacterized protein BU26DRAFT_15759 [Trematosphaeria pertusa]KAF2256163.1 hypothetical protein BU26DRAFT_15759 [Trematosphaeria pertusa]
MNVVDLSSSLSEQNSDGTDKTTPDATASGKTILEIVPDGDIYVSVGDDVNGTLGDDMNGTVTYLVRAATLEAMSDLWAILVHDANLHGQSTYRGEQIIEDETVPTGAENDALSPATLSDRGSMPEIFLPLDYHETIAITLIAAHHRNWMLPSAIDVELLGELAVHCRTFGTEYLVTQVAEPWIERLASSALERGCHRWLHIAWVFQLDCIFEAQLDYWIWHSTGNAVQAGLFGPELAHHGKLGRDLQGKGSVEG